MQKEIFQIPREIFEKIEKNLNSVTLHTFGSMKTDLSMFKHCTFVAMPLH